MSKVIAGFSMSLDGFVADPDDGVGQVFKWYSAGGTDAEVMAGDGTFEMSREGAGLIGEAGRGAGVLVTARRTFDLARAWGVKHPMDVPMVVAAISGSMTGTDSALAEGTAATAAASRQAPEFLAAARYRPRQIARPRSGTGLSRPVRSSARPSAGTQREHAPAEPRWSAHTSAAATCLRRRNAHLPGIIRGRLQITAVTCVSCNVRSRAVLTVRDVPDSRTRLPPRLSVPS